MVLFSKVQAGRMGAREVVIVDVGMGVVVVDEVLVVVVAGEVVVV